MGKYLLFKKITKNFDWVLILSIAPILFFGLITMNSFVDRNVFFERQIMWIIFSLIVLLIVSHIDFRFMKRTNIVVYIYLFSVLTLVSLFILGSVFSGSQRWIGIGFLTFQPSEFAKLAIVVMLAKYFSRRHVEIRNYVHLLISGSYAFILFLLILAQPDFGSALIISFIWLGMVVVSGISKKHLLIVASMGIVAFLFLWNFILADYQKDRILTFVNPMEDIQGAGYNAYQAMVSVGSGQLTGKGVGFGSQSRLSFLPEYQTDFIFAAFAEEWGFIGVVILFMLYLLFLIRIIYISYKMPSNFESLFGLGISIMFMSHFIVHVGMNMGLMPITGLTLPFMSYGGTNMLISSISIGILMSFRRNNRTTKRDITRNEFINI